MNYKKNNREDEKAAKNIGCLKGREDELIRHARENGHPGIFCKPLDSR